MSNLAHKSIALIFLMIIVGACFSPIAFVPKIASAQAATASKAVAGAPAVAAACATTAAIQTTSTSVTATESVSVASTLGVLVALPPLLSGSLGGNSGSNIQNNQKQSCLNAIAWYLAKILIDQIVQSTIAWINSGFEGSPTFVSNPGQFFKNVADENFVEFMNALFPQTQGLTDLLCSPFAFDLKFKLLFKFNFNSRTRDVVKCRISDIAQNVEGFGKSFEESLNDFYQGNFSEGGWNRWLEFTQNPTSNPIGLQVATEEALSIKISSAIGEQKTTLDWGKGFHSITNKLGEGIQEIVTPGATIENALAYVTTEDIRQLGLADEFNEIVGALLGQLMKTAFASGGGISGLSRSSGTDGRSYLQRLQQSSNPEDLRVAEFATTRGTSSPDFIGSDIATSTSGTTGGVIDTENPFVVTLPTGVNMAILKPTTQSKTYEGASDRIYPSSIATDGQKQVYRSGRIDWTVAGRFVAPIAAVSVQGTANIGAWWQTDLGKEEYIEKVVIIPVPRKVTETNATNNFDLILSTAPFDSNMTSDQIKSLASTTFKYSFTQPSGDLPEFISINVPQYTRARYVRIQRYDNTNKSGRLELVEVEIHRGATPPAPTATSTTP